MSEREFDGPSFVTRKEKLKRDGGMRVLANRGILKLHSALAASNGDCNMYEYLSTGEELMILTVFTIKGYEAVLILMTLISSPVADRFTQLMIGLHVFSEISLCYCSNQSQVNRPSFPQPDFPTQRHKHNLGTQINPSPSNRERRPRKLQKIYSMKSRI